MDPVATISDLLLKSLSYDNAVRKQSESELSLLEGQPGFLIAILQLVGSHSASPQLRQSAAVMFKNAVKKRWSPGEDSEFTPVALSDRQTIKDHVVDLMCSTPPVLQKQLAEGVSIIAKYDFPGKWDGLLPQLVHKLSANDLHVTQGVMLTANSIMKRYRFTYKSDALFREILVCLNSFQEPLLSCYKRNSQLIASLSSDKPNLVIAMETHRLMTRIFFSLNWQDIPEYFEDHIAEWMEEFSKFLSYSNPLLTDAGELSEPSSIDKLQAAIIENLSLYATKYEEEFKPYLGPFTQSIWQLLLGLGPQTKQDILATNGIKFLTSVCGKQMNVGLFNDQILKEIVEHIVIPNLMATESDEELFEDNPTDYIRKDMEGSDQDTRRRCAIELVRALLKFFGPQVSKLCLDYITNMLEQYRVRKDWRSKDSALHLVLSVAVLSAGTQGAGEMNPNVNILDIFNAHVLPEVHDPDTNARPIVKADAIKLICIFRTHLQEPFLLSILPHIIRHLTSSSVVVQTYAALSIEKFLSIKDTNPQTGLSVNRISKESLLSQMQPLFTGLFAVLDNPDLPENDYVMKCIMRTLSVLGTDVVPLVSLILPRLTAVLERVCKNPINPQFNHYLFESVAILVRSGCSSSTGIDISAACSHFEAALFPSFQMVLTHDIAEFVPYVFQILAQLLSARPKNSGFSDAYRGLFPPLLAPVLWERKGNVPGLTDLFLAYIATGMAEIIAQNHFQAVLGVFQKLLTSKSTELYAFKLLNELFVYNSLATLQPYLGTIWNLCLIRMQEQMKENKTVRYCRLFLHSLCQFAIAQGADNLYQSLEGVSPGLISTIISQIWKVNQSVCTSMTADEIKRLLAGGTKLLCETPIARIPEPWSNLLDCLVSLLAVDLTAVVKTNEEEAVFEEAGEREFDSAYSKLVFAVIPSTPLSSDVQEAPAYFATSLVGLWNSNPQMYSSMIKSALSPENAQALVKLLQQTNNHNLLAALTN